ncbi:folate-binding protein YgfZ [Phenylobacterium sp.]|uniref:CAF17-like 4Fe-4S cluster assembly/insertion protein YgfZ n=2 Tax=Phenylobacterium sp. TaxID=1871053 RepID=UPI002732193A|nr:folate-binding protein [Phenylobacterium sp.]MDP1617665.1 folate-binding protein [Phenylobacterium sp.]
MVQTLSYVPLASRAVIALGGADWRDFLHNLISQNVETLAAGEIRFGALLTPQGKVLYDLFVIGREDGCWLDVAAEHRDAILQRLMIYRLRAKVTIAADEAEVAVLFGDGAAPGEGWLADPRLPQLGWRGYGAVAPQGAAMGGEADYAAFARSLGVPGPADWGTEQTYPIEANFDLLNGIDFKKGCFVGQETTSRMKRRGTVKTRFLPIRFEGVAPAPGAEVLAGELRAGQMLSGADGLAMASLRLDRIEGADLSVDGRPVRVVRPDWFERALTQ